LRYRKLTGDGLFVVEMRANVEDAVLKHFQDGPKPISIRLHLVRDEVISLIALKQSNTICQNPFNSFEQAQTVSNSSRSGGRETSTTFSQRSPPKRTPPKSGWRNSHTIASRASANFRKEVIQPQVLLRLPCYDFTPIMSHTLGVCSLAVSATTSSTTHFRDVTGGVYKARERIHGVDLIRHY
jgi:hypothetical protein